MRNGGTSSALHLDSTSRADAKRKQRWQIRFVFVCKLSVVVPRLLHRLILCFCVQVPRHKSKKGGIQKRVYFWGGISWWGKTPGVAWTAADNKVIFRHTKNLCHGTLFEDEGVVYRIVQTRAAAADNTVSYVAHFDFPDSIPAERHWEFSSHAEVREWHAASRAQLTQREDL